MQGHKVFRLQLQDMNWLNMNKFNTLYRAAFSRSTASLRFLHRTCRCYVVQRKIDMWQDWEQAIKLTTLIGLINTALPSERRMHGNMALLAAQVNLQVLRVTGKEHTLHTSLWHIPAIVARRVANGFTNLSVKLPCSTSGYCPMSPISNIVRFRGCHTGLSLVGAMPPCTNKVGCFKNQ